MRRLHIHFEFDGRSQESESDTKSGAVPQISSPFFEELCL